MPTVDGISQERNRIPNSEKEKKAIRNQILIPSHPLIPPNQSVNHSIVSHHKSSSTSCPTSSAEGSRYREPPSVPEKPIIRIFFSLSFFLKGRLHIHSSCSFLSFLDWHYYSFIHLGSLLACFLPFHIVTLKEPTDSHSQKRKQEKEWHPVSAKFQKII